MTKFPFLLMDFETFSTVDIGKCGSYRYMDDPSFEPLLLSYAMNDDPVKLVDFTHDEDWPEEFLAALHDPAITKIAWNCAFERNVIYTALGEYTPPEQWLDVMHVAAQCGLPMSLDAAGKALGLPEEQAKMKEGKALIRYFCCPCKPTKTNGGRERNFPEHAPERWKTFCDYCIRDTEAERTIFHMLEQWLPNEDERRFWALDQRINEKGVRIDRQLAINAVAMDERYKEELTAKAVALTGLENPKSVSQVKNWLADQEGKSFPSLNKKVIADVVSQLQSEDAREFMALRGELSKSSTAKYQAMLRSMCSDEHSKGCFQFYGANRTGRFCLTGDHEVLTPSGWAPLNMWQGGPIAVWSPTSRAISFQNSLAVSFPYDGEMISISQQRCEQLSTPEHKMPILSRAGVWEGREVQDVFGKWFPIPFTGVRGVSAPGDHIALRVLIMVQADGHFSVGGDLKLGFKKLRKVERCKTLLRRAEIPFMLREFQNGVQQFTIRRQDQPLWLRSFRDKTFGWWLLDEDGRTIVDELEYWDSHRCGPNSIQYCTTNRQNAEVLQAVCALNGYSATLLTKVRDGNTPNWNDAYTLNIWLTPGDSTIIRSNHQTKVPFSGTVYCAVTPTGYFLTRRNGKYWITGNSGKLVQFQNMSKNYSPSLAGMRELVRGGHYSALNALYDSVSGVLSELVRTAIIPEEGQRIVVADFSAIEARVTAWFAGEEWRLQTFRNGGDIYCMSASQMFHVPVVKHGINGELRQKGKVAELACIAEGELVLTDRGLIPIQDVTDAMRVWDGVEWVKHDGVVLKGEREVISYGGLTATADHLVWAEGQPWPIQFGLAAASGTRLVQAGNGRTPLRARRDHQAGKAMEPEMESLLRADPLHDLREGELAGPEQPDARRVEWLPVLFAAGTGLPEVAGPQSDGAEAALHKSGGQRVRELRSPRRDVRLPERERRLPVDRGEYRDTEEREGAGLGPHRQRQGLCTGEPSLVHETGEQRKPSEYPDHRMAGRGLAVQQNNCHEEARGGPDEGTDSGRGVELRGGEMPELESNKKVVRVYDIVNAGPRHRFTVSGVLVHNCGYGGGVSALKAFGADKMGMSEEEMQETVDLWRERSPRIVGLWRALEKAAIRCVVRRAPAVSTIGNVRFDFESGILWMTLPSGRRLAYYGAKYEETKFHPDRKSLTYMGVNQMTKRWERVETWGGKLTENCWAAGTPVLTARGWTPIEDVTADDLVWDGVEWVENDGSECQHSEKILCRLDGLLVTEDHKILTTEGWKDAKDCDGLERLPIQLPEGAELVPTEPRLSVRATTRRAGHGTPVYDVMNCGPRHRYVVLGESGPIIAHNCVQATARDVLREAMFSLTEKGWDIRAHVHDECICTEPIGGKTVEQMCKAMCPDIPWAKGLPLNADGYDGPYYFKD